MNNYPRELHVDFSKLNTKTLKRYAWYFKVESKSEVRPELASSCARHFLNHLSIDEAQVLSNFEAYILNPNSVKRAQFSTSGTTSSSGKRPLPSSSQGSSSSSSSLSSPTEPPSKKRRHSPISEGKLVAAQCNENWILGKVMKYLKRKKLYKIEDADEMTKEKMTFEIPQDKVIALPNASEDDANAKKISFPNGTRVLARFPTTSTFYPATVVKRAEKNKFSLRFDDDERDADGKVRIVKVSGNEIVLEP